MVRGYIRTSKAWYARAMLKNGTPIWEVNFGMYYPKGGTAGEITMEWLTVGNKECPMLRCFDDAWKVLYSFSDVLQRLAEVDNKNITEEEFVAILDTCGFKDMTPYEREK